MLYMPKLGVDYSNTIIYKIECKDKRITEFYIGHTTNFIKRKYQHKTSCNTSTNLKLQIYKTIIDNGGWDNWEMIELAKYDCKNSKEAKIKELEHYELLKSVINIKQNHFFQCDNCGKEYKGRNGLWYHKQKCLNTIISINHEPDTTNNELIMMLIKENSEFKSMMMKLLEKGVNTNTTNITTNSHNKSFNLNVYLNETCKDAMNMSDFISSINLNLEDLEHTGRQGYIEGISHIVVKNLNNMEHHMRPLHCCDLKREILYIKDNNIWTKESDKKPILTKAIKTIANENIKQIKTWRDKHPKCTEADSKNNNLYLKIVSNSMNGLTEEEGHKNINKIISNIAKKVVIEK